MELLQKKNVKNTLFWEKETDLVTTSENKIEGQIKKNHTEVITKAWITRITICQWGYWFPLFYEFNNVYVKQLGIFTL